MPTTNTERSASAPRAPHQAVDAGRRVAATASSARGKQQPEGGGERRWHAEVDDGLPGAFAVGELGHASYGEDQGQQQPRDE